MRGATFRVMDVPVLWFPILSFPALSDRATGFLMPRFGYSARRGFQFEQPFFWNISKSQDATVAVDVETAARIGLLGEYRYMLSDEARGSFAGGYWNESIRTSKADEIVSRLRAAAGQSLAGAGQRRAAALDRRRHATSTRSPSATTPCCARSGTSARLSTPGCAW